MSPSSVLAAGLAVIALVLAGAASAQARTTTFISPSGQIGCIYLSKTSDGPAFLRCDTRYPTRFSGKKSCREGDYGQAFSMERKGRARPQCASDSAFGGTRKLRYGTTRRFGPFTCTSRTSGLTCRNRSRHGWTLSRERQLIF